MSLGIAAVLGIFLTKDASLVHICRVYPEYIRDPETPAKEEDVIEVRCGFQTEFEPMLCMFEHDQTTIWCVNPDAGFLLMNNCIITDSDRITAKYENNAGCYMNISNNGAKDLGQWVFQYSEAINIYKTRISGALRAPLF